MPWTLSQEPQGKISLHGALHFCGFKVLAPQISFAPEFASEEERKAMVASWAQRLKTIWKEDPIPCTPSWYFGQ
ncbi:N-ribosyldihydronicotinamide:quinone reductase 2 [Phyllostomus discolor]|uniref:N-ribosyldihydronicotinamide:quinone reductase 2 n=1 Tax=Phyllostomus discolor TaxID=89673 RepID=A0A834EDH6_9CHIR|nr:N-ribosyldihydronicotinamide:quinone reductase 2 [Phyllostomus discolor]